MAGEVEVYVVEDPSGSLPGDDELRLIPDIAGIKVQQDDNELMQWKWADVASFSSAPQSDDPEDMEILTVKTGSKAFVFEVDDGTVLVEAMMKAKKASQAKPKRKPEMKRKHSRKKGMAQGLDVSAFVEAIEDASDEQIDRLLAALVTGRAAFTFANAVGGTVDPLALPKTIPEGQLKILLQAFDVQEFYDTIVSSTGGTSDPLFDTFVEFVGGVEVGFEQHLFTRETPAVQRAREADMGKLRRIFDRMDLDGSKTLQSTEIDSTLFALGITRDDDDAVRETIRCFMQYRGSVSEMTDDVTWIEFSVCVVNRTLESLPHGKTLNTRLPLLIESLNVFQIYPLECSESCMAAIHANAELPEEVALVFTVNGQVQLSPVTGPLTEAPLGKADMRLVKSCDVTIADDAEEYDVVSLEIVSNGDSAAAVKLEFEVEDGDHVKTSFNVAHQGCVHIVTPSNDGLPSIYRAQVKAAFDVFDINRDGVVDSEEFLMLLKVLNAEKDWEEIWRKIDVDSDGVANLIDFESAALNEVRATTKANMKAESSKFLNLMQNKVVQVREAFDRCDVDGNGAIDVDELQLVLRALGHNFSDESVESMLTAIDLDNSGSVEWSEFLEAIAYKHLSQFNMNSIFHVESVAIMSSNQTKMKRQLEKMKAAKKKIAARISTLQSRLDELEKKTGAEKGSSMRMIEDKIAAHKEKDATERGGKTLNAMRDHRHRKDMLERLKVDHTAINGWRIRITRPAWGEAVVLEASKPRRMVPTKFKVRFDDPVPGQGQDLSLVLDRKAPGSGKRAISRRKSDGAVEWTYIKYPFELLGTGPADDHLAVLSKAERSPERSRSSASKSKVKRRGK